MAVMTTMWGPVVVGLLLLLLAPLNAHSDISVVPRSQAFPASSKGVAPKSPLVPRSSLNPSQLAAIASKAASAPPPPPPPVAASAAVSALGPELPSSQPPSPPLPPSTVAAASALPQLPPPALSSSPAVGSRPLPSVGSKQQPVSLHAALPAVAKSALLTGQARASVYQPYKPVIGKSFHAHLMQFMEPTQPFENCQDIAAAMQNNEGTLQAHIHFSNILSALDPSAHDEPGESITTDKYSVTDLNYLQDLIVDRHAAPTSGHSLDLLGFMNRIIRCKVDMQTGRGILQKILELGLEQSLKTPFALTLLKGTPDFDPALILDLKGNTLMHLAVGSDAYNVPTYLVHMEERKNADNPSRRMNALFWTLSTLTHKNKDGQRPLDMCRTPALKDKLKRYFRSYTHYLKFQGKKYGIRDSEINQFEQLLKTSSSLNRA